MTEFQAIASGTAIVCCIHNRQKRQVTTETHVAELGQLVGQIYDPKQHKLHLCACCQNLFVDPSDIPRYCTQCGGAPVHPLGGPLPDATGEVV